MKRTTAPLTKFAPFTVMVKALTPMFVTVGKRPLIAGTGLMTERGSVAVVPPPGAGLETAMGNVPVAATSDSRITAVNCVGLTKVVARASPLKLTMELLLKFVPVAVSRNALVPTI